MADFILRPEENGTLLKACTDTARDWTVNTFKMMADPILDDDGLQYALRLLESAGLEVHDART